MLNKAIKVRQLGLLISYLFFQSFILNCKAFAEEIDSSLMIGFGDSNSIFGKNFEGLSGFVAGDFYFKALSAHFNLKEGRDVQHYEFELAYSYAFEKANVSGGLGYFEFSSLNENIETPKLFIEIEGRQEIFGFIPELHFSKSINKSSRDYLNLRLSREIYSGNYLINPYAEFAMGSIFSESFKSNNILFGFDIVTPIGDELYLSPHIALNIPLDSVKEFDEEANTSIELGIALRKDF